MINIKAGVCYVLPPEPARNYEQLTFDESGNIYGQQLKNINGNACKVDDKKNRSERKAQCVRV